MKEGGEKMDTGGRPKNWPGEEHPGGKEKQKTLNLTLSHSAASHPSLPLAKREPENKSPPLPLLFSPEAGHFRATLRHPSLGHFHLHQTDSAREPPWPSAIFLSPGHSSSSAAHHRPMVFTVSRSGAIPLSAAAPSPDLPSLQSPTIWANQRCLYISAAWRNRSTSHLKQVQQRRLLPITATPPPHSPFAGQHSIAAGTRQHRPICQPKQRRRRRCDLRADCHLKKGRTEN